MTDKAEARSTPESVTATEGSTARTEAPTLTAGRELDALIAEKVFGMVRCENLHHDGNFPNDYCFASPDSPNQGAEVKEYSTDLTAALEVVATIQERHPGWRFLLLGGDRQWGYRRGDADDYVVVKSVSSSFGWSAEFFGERDPTIDYGARHGQAHHIETPALAICLAALKAVSPPVLSQTEEGK